MILEQERDDEGSHGDDNDSRFEEEPFMDPYLQD